MEIQAALARRTLVTLANITESNLLIPASYPKSTKGRCTMLYSLGQKKMGMHISNNQVSEVEIHKSQQLLVPHVTKLRGCISNSSSVLISSSPAPMVKQDKLEQDKLNQYKFAQDKLNQDSLKQDTLKQDTLKRELPLTTVQTSAFHVMGASAETDFKPTSSSTSVLQLQAIKNQAALLTKQGRPKILFFDSGVGGLSVFADTAKLNSQAAYYYLFDHECFPYGSKSEAFLQERVLNLLERVGAIIHPDLIVIACNTASTTVLRSLREVLPMPIVGVVPAIKPAAALSLKHRIVLLATPGTVKRQYTEILISKFASDCEVLKLGSEELVYLAEEHVLTAALAHSQASHALSHHAKTGYEPASNAETAHEPVSNAETGCEIASNSASGSPVPVNEAASHLSASMDERLRHILAPVLNLPKDKQADVLILGCTHFPWLKKEIQEIVGPEIKLIDSGQAIARRVAYLLSIMLHQNAHTAESSLAESGGSLSPAGIGSSEVTLYPASTISAADIAGSDHAEAAASSNQPVAVVSSNHTVATDKTEPPVKTEQLVVATADAFASGKASQSMSTRNNGSELTQVAFFTGKVSSEEQARLSCVLSYFGFNQLVALP